MLRYGRARQGGVDAPAASWLGPPDGSQEFCGKGGASVACSERKKELRRRRHRRKKVEVFSRKLEKATVSEKAAMAQKLRGLTPGAEILIERWELEKR